MISDTNEVFSRPNDKAISYNLEQFALWGEGQQGKQGTSPRMIFGERNGAPRISVFTRRDDIKCIWMGFDPIVFEMFLAKLENVAKSKEPVADFIQNMEKSKEGKGFSVRNTLHFGKDESGIVYLEVEEKNIRIPFKLTVGPWHKFHRVSDGQPMSDSEVSALRTIGMANVLRRVFGNWSSRLQQPNKDGNRKKSSDDTGSKPATSSFSNDDFVY